MSIQRFHDAQGPVISQVYDELLAGKKESHWVWFIFPQGPREGSSETANYFALSDEEAAEYLDDPLLAYRLETCVAIVTDHLRQGKELEAILSPVDALKYRSCLELFGNLPNAPVWLRWALRASCPECGGSEEANVLQDCPLCHGWEPGD